MLLFRELLVAIADLWDALIFGVAVHFAFKALQAFAPPAGELVVIGLKDLAPAMPQVAALVPDEVFLLERVRRPARPPRPLDAIRRL